jgi:hypothetical protein
MRNDAVRAELIGAPVWKTNDISGVTDWESFTDSISGMFEGELTTPNTTNKLYLSVDPDTVYWIDGDEYNQFSFAGRCQRSAALYLGWLDGNGNPGSVLIDTLTTDWEQMGPYDLSDTWDSKTIQELWLRFVPLTGNMNMHVRLGWVKLTE